MRYINDSEKKQYVLNDYSESDKVRYVPAEYWYIDLFLICLNDGGISNKEENDFLILEYPSYSDVQSTMDLCIWSTPYVAYLFSDVGLKRFDSVSEIKKYYERNIVKSKDILEELRNYRLYHMGISNYELIEGHNYIEYKVSPRQHDKWKCYYVQEHYVVNVDPLGLKNLCDPEGVHEYRYLPINEKTIKDGDRIVFSGKPLSSNVDYTLKTSYKNILNNRNWINSNLLVYNMHGLAFSIDIVGFTKLYNRICNEMKTFDKKGKAIAIQFVAKIAYVFEQQMNLHGISQYSIEGDGLKGTIPLADDSNINTKIEELIKLFYDIRASLSELAIALGEEIRIRCVFLEGDYLFGKLAGLQSSSQVTGEVLITLSRMDQSLKEEIHNIMNKKWNVALCISNDLLQKHSFEKECLVEFNSKTEYRETTINSRYFYKEEI